jgi:hypothetical protein
MLHSSRLLKMALIDQDQIQVLINCDKNTNSKSYIGPRAWKYRDELATQTNVIEVSS